MTRNDCRDSLASKELYMNPPLIYRRRDHASLCSLRPTAAVAIAVLVFGFGAAGAHALDVPLTVSSRESSGQAQAVVTSGVPFPPGVLPAAGEVRVLQADTEIPTQSAASATWPDGTVRWLLLSFQADLHAGAADSFTVRTGAAPTPAGGVSVQDDQATLTIRTGTAVFSLGKAELQLAGRNFQVDSGGATYTAVPAGDQWVVEEPGPVRAVIRADGTWRNGDVLLADSPLLTWRARLYFFRNRADVRLQLTFRNGTSFGWDGESARGPDVALTRVRFGSDLLPEGGPYVLGPGVEKTFTAELSADGATVRASDTRYDATGAVASGYDPPAALAVAPPTYYATTDAWGHIVLPVTAAPAGLQEDFDRFEKFRRAMVSGADVENPPGQTGITLWSHLAQDLPSWHDYGDIRWGGDTGTLSGNHYDWSYSLYTQFLRTGTLAFADAAGVLAAHEIDMDIYHTTADGTAYSHQKNWESRDTHDNPDNGFGPGRPSHTWAQGYALHWLLTGDPRGRDGFEEIIDGIRRFLYESFNGEGYVNWTEIRHHGWMMENLVSLWRMQPDATLTTTSYGAKTIPNVIKDLLRPVFDLEAAAGGQGFVYAGDPPDPAARQPVQHLYFIEPAIKAYDEVFKGRDPEYAAQLRGLILRMTSWLMGITYGGVAGEGGTYLPRQIPYWIDLNNPDAREGQVPYILMAANAAAFAFLETGDESYRAYARLAFSDYVRYMGVVGGDAYADPAARTPTAFNSAIYVDTESKVHGWMNRYGAFVLLEETRSPVPALRGGWSSAGLAAILLTGGLFRLRGARR
ncbi:MAG: hypothetical protein HYV63_12940 [Candidatus Schekmanbacteria bacterium]|nr:hypothetical protein [Candidatus Schekmanbacteria bacterium]